MISNSEEFHPWNLIYNDYNPELEKSRESLLAIGNGYLGSRGAMEECEAGENNYPGTYIAGLYNRLISKVADKDIVNEDFVNTPNWHGVSFRIDDGGWVDVNEKTIISIKRELNLRNGVLSREMILRDPEGRETRIESQRLASMDDPHLLAIQYSLRALNYSGEIEIKTILDGDLINDGVARYRDLDQKQLKAIDQNFTGNLSYLEVETVQSGIRIAEVSRSELTVNGENFNKNIKHISSEGKLTSSFKIDINKNDELILNKVVSVFTSKPDDVENPLPEAMKSIFEAGTYDEIVNASSKAWEKIWEQMDIRIDGDSKSQLLIRLHLYHLLVTASPHNVEIDAGIPARGLHGEAYRGHIFWDELYILPVFNLFFPEITKSVLKYRYKRLDKARKYAKEYGFEGAMFPWQSGSDGREETQVLHLNPVSGKWGDDYSSLQRHISIAVAYNIWYYNQIAEDQAFMAEMGAEVFFEICRFWASKAELNEESGRYSILKVMGPDEFHELHPNSPDGGVKDNAYTNIMVSWLFRRAKEYWDILPAEITKDLKKKAGITIDEVENWIEIAGKLYLDISEGGVLGQFDGYFDLQELDWDAYRKKYTNIYRLDRILKAEGKSPDDYKLAKQADLLMTYYNLDADDIQELLGEMSYKIGKDALKTNYDYYMGRTSHGSTLSRVVHAYLANQMGDYKLGWELYSEALASDYTDIQGGTTAEGIHAGVMGGTVLMAITSFLGINLKQDHLIIDPHLPENWKGISLGFNFKSCFYQIDCQKNQVEISVKSEEKKDISIDLCGKKIVLQPNSSTLLEY